MTNTNTTTKLHNVAKDRLEELRRRAVNDITREISATGCLLTHEQADELGEETLAWMRHRLGLETTETDLGVECRLPDGLVTVETMPDYLRETHRAARNWGAYPHNGAVRDRYTLEDAEEIVASDPDSYARIV